MSLFYVGQVNLIKETRKTLKKQVREIVDKVGPQLYKNFDQMRMIMFDPSKSQSGEEKKGMRKSQSVSRLGLKGRFAPLPSAK